MAHPEGGDVSRKKATKTSTIVVASTGVKWL